MLRRTFVATALLAGAAAPLAAQVSVPASADGPTAVVRLLADPLERGYVVPETGRRYAAMLRQRLTAGAYAGITEPAALAEQLTAELRAVAVDGHLRIVPLEALPPGERFAGAPPTAPAPRPVAPRAGPPRIPALQDAGWIADGVAYLRYTGFNGQPDNMAGTEAFMRDHAGARALILDCRYNGGGGMDEMDVILPYLFATETRMVAFEMVEAVARERGIPFEGPTVRAVLGRPGIVRHEHVITPRTDETRWRSAKVLYLTAPRTASAAEHLALAFKHTDRATLIGATTAGANHFGAFEPLGWGLAVFLPVGRTVDLTTGEDWEAKGVAPDVAVAPVTAVQEALRRAGVGVPATG